MFSLVKNNFLYFKLNIFLYKYEFIIQFLYNTYIFKTICKNKLLRSTYILIRLKNKIQMRINHINNFIFVQKS